MKTAFDRKCNSVENREFVQNVENDHGFFRGSLLIRIGPDDLTLNNDATPLWENREQQEVERWCVQGTGQKCMALALIFRSGCQQLMLMPEKSRRHLSMLFGNVDINTKKKNLKEVKAIPQQMQILKKNFKAFSPK